MHALLVRPQFISPRKSPPFVISTLQNTAVEMQPQVDGLNMAVQIARAFEGLTTSGPETETRFVTSGLKLFECVNRWKVDYLPVRDDAGKRVGGVAGMPKAGKYWWG